MAAAGAVKAIMAEMERLRVRLAASDQQAAGQGLVGVSWNDAPGGFRYLMALRRSLPMRARVGLKTFHFPEMRFAAAWHAAGDGDVLAHYLRMFDWIAEKGCGALRICCITARNIRRGRI